MDQFKDLLADLHQNEIFKQHLENVLKDRPALPSWTGGNGEDNADQWKHMSSLQQGFDLCYQKLTMTKPPKP